MENGASDGDEATTLDLSRLIEQRHADAGGRHAALVGGGAWHGPFHGPRRGQGLEFDDLRPYAVGDDVRHIDWKTSARRAALHTRLYREEKEHVLTVALDLRASMYTGSATLRSVEAGLLAARLLWRASAGGSRVGVTALHEGGLSFSRPASGERGALSGCRVVAETFALGRRAVGVGESVSGGTPATTAPAGPGSSHAPSITLQTLTERLLAGGRSLGRTVILTGLDAPGADVDAALARLAAARPLAVVHIEDPLERVGLPPGRYRYAAVDGIRTVRVGRAESRRLRNTLASRRTALTERFTTAGIPLLSSEEGVGNVVATLRRDGFLP